MITMLGTPRRYCDGITRRETLKAGALSLCAGLNLPNLLHADLAARVDVARHEALGGRLELDDAKCFLPRDRWQHEDIARAVKGGQLAGVDLADKVHTPLNASFVRPPFERCPFWTVTDDLAVEVAREAFDEGGPDGLRLTPYHGRRLAHLPRYGKLARPSSPRLAAPHSPGTPRRSGRAATRR